MTSRQWNMSFVREVHDWEVGVEIVQIGSGRSLPRKDCSRSSPSSAHWLALKVDASLGRVCGGLKLL